MIGVPDEKWGETIKALVVLRRGRRASTEAELIALVQGRRPPATRRRPRSSSARSSPARPPASCRSSSCARRTGRAATARSTDRGPRPPVRCCRMTSGPADVVDLLTAGTHPRTADGWDAVGLVGGDPDARRTPGAVRRRPGARRSPRGGRVGRRPAGRAPPAVPRGRARSRPPPQGPRRAHAAARAGARCSPRTPTPTSPTGGVSSRWRWRSACRTCAAWSRCSRTTPLGQARGVRARRPTPSGCARRWPQAGAGRDRRLRPGVVHDAGRGPVPAAAPARDPRSARSASSRWSTRCGSRRSSPRARRAGGGRRDAGGAPLRGAGVRRGRAGRARRPTAARAGSAGWPSR